MSEGAFVLYLSLIAVGVQAGTLLAGRVAEEPIIKELCAVISMITLGAILGGAVARLIQ